MGVYPRNTIPVSFPAIHDGYQAQEIKGAYYRREGGDVQADLTVDLNNWVREGDRVQWFFAGRDKRGRLYLISLLEHVPPTVHDDQLHAVTMEGARRSVPALGIPSVTPISPDRFQELKDSSADAHSFLRGPRIGVYKGMGIPEYVEVDGLRYAYAGIAPKHHWIIDPERYFVTDGLLFERSADFK